MFPSRQNPVRILGIVGTLGAGKSEILHSIFGLEPLLAGEVFVDGKKINITEPQAAIRNGLALIPEERRDALVMDASIARNITLASLSSVCSAGGWISRSIEERTAMRYKDSLSIATPNVKKPVGFLAVGMSRRPLYRAGLIPGPNNDLLDEPTKRQSMSAPSSEIYGLIGNLVKDGAAVIYATKRDKRSAFTL